MLLFPVPPILKPIRIIIYPTPHPTLTNSPLFLLAATSSFLVARSGQSTAQKVPAPRGFCTSDGKASLCSTEGGREGSVQLSLLESIIYKPPET